MILDELLSKSRSAWLAYFDATLLSLVGEKLTITFTDSNKFINGHDYDQFRSDEMKRLLEDAIEKFTGEKIIIVEKNFEVS